MLIHLSFFIIYALFPSVSPPPSFIYADFYAIKTKEQKSAMKLFAIEM